MRLSAAPAVVLWGAFLVVLTAVGLLFFDTTDETPLLLGGAAAIALAAGLALGLRGLGRPDDPPPLLPRTSPPTVLLAAGLALLAVSPELGVWLAVIAAGTFGLAAGGLVRELAAQRRDARSTAAGADG
ncbi:MAG: hypothetical protein ACJ75R_10225 [Solirubrobacterales bacterium]